MNYSPDNFPFYISIPIHKYDTRLLFRKLYRRKTTRICTQYIVVWNGCKRFNCMLFRLTKKIIINNHKRRGLRFPTEQIQRISLLFCQPLTNKMITSMPSDSCFTFSGTHFLFLFTQFHMHKKKRQQMWKSTVKILGKRRQYFNCQGNRMTITKPKRMTILTKAHYSLKKQ